MLSKRDLSINIHQLHFLSLLGILPVTVKGGRLKASKSYKSLSLFVFYMILVQSHILFSAFLTVDKLHKEWRDALPTISLDYLFVVSIQMCLFTVFVNFVLHGDQVCEIFNGCLVHENYLVSTKSSFIPCIKLKFKDLVTKYLPISVNLFVVEFCVVCTLARTLPAFSNTDSFIQAVAIGLDFVVVLCATQWAYFAFLLHILFIEKVSYVLQRETLSAKDTITTNIRKLRSTQFSCAAMRTLQVEIKIFNSCQANIVCVIRAAVTGLVVFCGLTVIEFFYLHPIIGVFNGICVVYSSLLYVTMYNNGFQLPRKCQAWKRLHLRQIHFIYMFTVYILHAVIRSITVGTMLGSSVAVLNPQVFVHLPMLIRVAYGQIQSLAKKDIPASFFDKDGYCWYTYRLALRKFLRYTAYLKPLKPFLHFPDCEFGYVTFDTDLHGNRTVKSFKTRASRRGVQGLSNDVPHKAIEQGPI